jgi:hypothetical protein
VFDWDLAGPTTPLLELAFIAWNCVPLWHDMGDEASAERIRRICLAYGGIHPAHLVDAVPRRIQMMLDWIPLAAASGDAGLRRLMSQGEPERSQASASELTLTPAVVSVDGFVPEVCQCADNARLAGS